MQVRLEGMEEGSEHANDGSSKHENVIEVTSIFGLQRKTLVKAVGMEERGRRDGSVVDRLPAQICIYFLTAARLLECFHSDAERTVKSATSLNSAYRQRLQDSSNVQITNKSKLSNLLAKYEPLSHNKLRLLTALGYFL